VSTPEELQTLRDGSFRIICGKCLHHSDPLVAVSANEAWAQFIADGWTLFRAEEIAHGRSYPICAKCTASPNTIDDAVRRARKRT
jgi:hypothetical protein